MPKHCVGGCRYLWESGTAARQVTVDQPDAVTCTSTYSREVPYTRGLVVFPVTEDRSVTAYIHLYSYSLTLTVSGADSCTCPSHRS